MVDTEAGREAGPILAEDRSAHLGLPPPRLAAPAHHASFSGRAFHLGNIASVPAGGGARGVSRRHPLGQLQDALRVAPGGRPRGDQAGTRLALNLACEAGGQATVELQDEQGKPLPGYAMGDCDPVTGDAVTQIVSWRGKSAVRALAGKAVKVRIALREARLYAFGFEG